MKVAHVVMASKDPSQIERMLKSMNHSDFYFYIHLDKKIDIKPFEYLSMLDRVTFISDRRICNWGGFSFVKAIFASIEEILNTGEHFDFYNLMSGQDYPIKPIQEIVDFYDANQGKCFISYDEDVNSEWWSHAVTRYELYHFTDFAFKGRYFVQGLFERFLPKRTFPLPYKLYGSSNSCWWSITPECARYLVDFMKGNLKLQRFMSYTWGADEFLIATIVMNSPFKDQVINNNLRFITWEDGSARPRILTIIDLESIKASDKLFARKFDRTVDELILDELDLISK